MSETRARLSGITSTLPTNNSITFKSLQNNLGDLKNYSGSVGGETTENVTASIVKKPFCRQFALEVTIRDKTETTYSKIISCITI
ncbi:unnamed protein product [Allacma fusca]|uniref:Uncharacterized protein n=1 Tax=Allacma fusca TaxID=39272 RepID=A0A8J2JT81_9HEXA|nr:unnamed protein product [Allacma fusca]